VIDTHCHLDTLENPDEAVLEMTAVVAIGHDPEHARACLALSERLGNVFVVVGLHPTDANRDSSETRADLEALMMRPKVVGIGETGVDYYWDAAPKSVQMAALEWQLDCARRLDVPVVIHTRDKDNSRAAYLDCADALRNAGWHRGILHCFSGDQTLLETGLEIGFHVSYAGNLTYKNAVALRESALRVPLERFLVETDAPYLAPVPNRGKRNHPAWVRYTLEVLAQVRGLEFAEMERITEENARAVYGLPKQHLN
jgi:TatD DNase family protein